MLRHILLQFVERHFTIFEGGTNNLMLLIPHAKYNPAKLAFTQVSFIAEGREVLTQFIYIEVGFSLLKFYHFIFGMFP